VFAIRKKCNPFVGHILGGDPSFFIWKECHQRLIAADFVRTLILIKLSKEAQVWVNHRYLTITQLRCGLFRMVAFFHLFISMEFRFYFNKFLVLFIGKNIFEILKQKIVILFF
jgi:hypothetical protein